MKVKVLWTDCVDSPEDSLSTDDDQSEDDDEDNDEDNDGQTLEVDSDELQISNDEPDNEIEENTNYVVQTEIHDVDYTEPSTIAMLDWKGFKIVGDNVDKNIRPSFQRVNNRTVSLH